MIIGIDGSRAFVKQRTGIEEYSYQIIKELAGIIDDYQVVLYLKKDQQVGFDLPNNWKIKVIKFPRFWTQVGLSFELWRNPISTLFVSAHTIPFIHPKNSIVVVHGLEFEIMPEAYSFWERIYMRISIKKSCYWAKTIVAVSKNTKKDLIELYGVLEDKIKVIYEGVNIKQEKKISDQFEKYKPYIFFVGRLEKRKNIEGMISAFEILKDKYNIPHKLILSGKPGFGYLDIKNKIEKSEYSKEIIETGFVDKEKKWQIMRNAEVFLFPTFYEGFGLPIIEAQSVGVPVVASNVSSLPEIGGESVAYATPDEPVSIADSMWKILNNENYKEDLIRKGYENIKRFNWKKSAQEISKLLA